MVRAVLRPKSSADKPYGSYQGGVNEFDTNWYEESTCWPRTRSHKGGDERLYRFDPDANGIPALLGRYLVRYTCEQDIDFTVLCD